MVSLLLFSFSLLSLSFLQEKVVAIVNYGFAGRVSSAIRVRAFESQLSGVRCQAHVTGTAINPIGAAHDTVHHTYVQRAAMSFRHITPLALLGFLTRTRLTAVAFLAELLLCRRGVSWRDTRYH